MSKGPISLVIGVLLLIAALCNIGGGIAQYTKGSIVKGTTSMFAGVATGVVSRDRNDPFAALGDRLKQQSRELEQDGAALSTRLYLLAAFMFLTAVLQIVASIGLFSPKGWTSRMLLVGAITGAAVEFIDMARSGVGGGQLMFLAIYGLAAYLALPGLSAAPTTAPARDGAAVAPSGRGTEPSEDEGEQTHLSHEAVPQAQSIGRSRSPSWVTSIENMQALRGALEQVRDNARLPVDEKISLLQRLGGSFSWQAGTACKVAFGGREHFFLSGREFGQWLATEVVPVALSHAGQGPAPERKGTCPKCSARLPLSSATCPECNTEFGAGSRWKDQAY